MATDLAASRSSGVRLHQVVATQAAGVLLLIGAAAGGPALFAAAVGAALVLALTWWRSRGRWAFEWLAAGLRFGARRRPAATVLQLVSPGAHLATADLPSGPAAVLADASGLTVLLELGDPADLLAVPGQELAAPWELVSADGRERPSCRVQLLLTGVPAPAGPGPVPSSYRALAEGRALGHARAVLAVRVLRDEGWSDAESRRALTGLARRLTKRLTAQPLGPAAALRTIADLTYADPAAEVHEEWTALRAGDLFHVVFRMLPEEAALPPAELLTGLLHLPVAATTVTLTADLPEPGSADPPLISLAVRLTARDQAALEAAATSVQRVSAALRRLDGDHLGGLTATLPLADPGHCAPAGHGWHSRRPSPAARRFGSMPLPTGWAGVVMGRNRHGHPLPVRLFRPEPTRMLLVGGLRCAQLLVFRSLAVGARVLVRTCRPRDWAGFARGTAAPDDAIILAPPDHPVEPPPGTPLRPLLTILDLDARPGATRGRISGPWEATVTTREAFGEADVVIATGADLVLLQPLRPEEAGLIGGALGLGDVARLLTRMRPGMVGVISHQAVRWATLSPTDVEKVLIGDPSRSAAER
ncbi:type VII secretion protein EccE [Actinoplanes sp. NPDC020271]|uniref:type VII secretion protein EccE n=1 Tax=Actinoplanes sp. NPDC020271 TaxID=3363896 RepID=UPI0037986EA7